MTDEQIIKALECCIKNDVVCSDNCPGQKLDGDWKYECRISLMQKAIDLINRLKAQNKELDEKIVMQMGLITEQKAEIEKLEEMIELGDYSSYSAHLAIKDRQRKNAEYTNELKAEIERLKIEYDIMRFTTAKRWVKEAKTEAIKEFAKRLKEYTTTARFEQGKYSYEIVTEQSIDNLVKEMTEVQE